MKHQFVEHRFGVESTALIFVIERIMNSYEAQGFKLSLRQLYYQLVAQCLLPDGWEDPHTGSKNNPKSYAKIGDLVTQGRMAGLLDWDMIEDRTREMIQPPMWKNPSEIVQAAAGQFAIDRWKEQNNHVEVMVEKSALEGVLIPVCRELGIRFTANRGYSSASTMYEAGQRLRHFVRMGKEVHIIYLGDHDPSGMDMTRDIRERLSLFSGGDVDTIRVALNFDQVEKLNPPENPAKLSDSRAAAYIEEFGESSWELDAIEPRMLADLVTKRVKKLTDKDQWEVTMATEAQMREDLQAMADDYETNNSE